MWISPVKRLPVSHVCVGGGSLSFGVRVRVPRGWGEGGLCSCPLSRTVPLPVPIVQVGGRSLMHCYPDATGEQFLVPDAAGESSWVWCFAWLLLVGREAGSVVLVSPPLVLGTRLVLRLRGAHTHKI